MGNKAIVYSSFPFDWVVKSTPYSIRFKKAFEVNQIDEIFCSIINAKGGSIDKIEFGTLLGFNLFDDSEKGSYNDIAEEAIFNQYLKDTFEYDLIKEDGNLIVITDSGVDSLTSKLKFKYFDAVVTLFENLTVKGEEANFSFHKTFNLENRRSILKLNSIETEVSDELIKKKLQFQLFENDIFNGEVLQIFENGLKLEYTDFKLTCQLKEYEDTFKISLFYNGIEKLELEPIVWLHQNSDFLKELFYRGEFHHIIDSNCPINTNIINRFHDLWDWNKLAENVNVSWSESDVFKVFKENSEGSTWCIISKQAPLDDIKLCIQDYHDYWDWRVLSQRFDNGYILETLDKFTWDFEELSQKDEDFIIQLLETGKFKNEDWDWYLLTEVLPNDFIVENINFLPWDFYLLTTAKFEVFKKVFKADVDGHLKNAWNWDYISEKIDITYLHRNISKFSKTINWEIVLKRFFTDEDILNKCFHDEAFKRLLKIDLPEHFNITHQNYLWSVEVISFFDKLDLINWETTSYSKGFDTNENVNWSIEIFDRYSHKIKSEKGYSNVSSLIFDDSLLLKDFNWDWTAISKNKAIISNVSFLTKVITQPISIINNFEWEFIYPLHEISFWNANLLEFAKNTRNENTLEFWRQLTRDEDTQFVLSNYSLPWDWTFITKNTSVEIIVDSLENEELASNWDWKIATKKFDKKSILDYLEVGAEYWDWNYIIKEVFSVDDELKMEGGKLPKIAHALSVLGDEKKKEYWQTLTSVFSIKTLYNYIENTIENSEFEWDWDIISAKKHLPTGLVNLYDFRNKLNWTILSSSESIQQKFSYSNWQKNSKGCSENINKYLNEFKDYWDWKVLSKNKDLNWDRRLLMSFRRQNWDWEYLSEFGSFLTKGKKDNDDYLLKLFLQFRDIDFGVFSKRNDLEITSELIQSFKNLNWDWDILSTNTKAEITPNLLIELKHKPWNWGVLSGRKDIELDNEVVLSLLDKDWDWNYLSQNTTLDFSYDFIDKTKSKSWNWQAVSRHKTFLPTVEILSITKDFDLDWDHISKHSSLNPTKELLSKFEDKWNWESITTNPRIDFSESDFLQRFANKWNWHFICESGKLPLNIQFLKQFKENLDWNLISSNTNIDYTKEIIQEFKQYWNWTVLKENKRVEELLGSYIIDEINNEPILNFIDKIEQQKSNWKGHIYHFSHIDNAVQIIRERKIKSRKTANQMSDSAGNVVYSRTDAHSYSRFYFRPHTQTQFYNEYTGVDMNMGYKNKFGEWHSWYDIDYRRLDFPKCPKPIYFEFSLQEVLFKNFEKCNISTGNMQRNRTKFGKIEEMIHKFNFIDLFINPGMDSEEWKKFREYAQQEFMVENELDFSNLNFKIICSSNDDREFLIQLLGVDSIDVIGHIVVDSSYYRNENPSIRHNVSDDEIFISSPKKADGYFILTSDNISTLEVIEGDLIRYEEQKIIFKSFIKIKNHSKIVVKYVDEIKQEWFVLSNYELRLEDYQDIRLKTYERKKARSFQMQSVFNGS